MQAVSSKALGRCRAKLSHAPRATADAKIYIDGMDYDQRYLMTKIQSNRRKIHILGGRDLKDTTAVGECNEKPRLRGSETAAVNRPRERVAPEV